MLPTTPSSTLSPSSALAPDTQVIIGDISTFNVSNECLKKVVADIDEQETSSYSSTASTKSATSSEDTSDDDETTSTTISASLTKENEQDNVTDGEDDEEEKPMSCLPSTATTKSATSVDTSSTTESDDSSTSTTISASLTKEEEHENDVNDEEEAEKAATTKKTVTFSTKLTKQHTIPPIHHMTQDEFESTYYTEFDFHRMDRENGYVVYLIENPDRIINPERHCVRGLEYETRKGKCGLIRRIKESQKIVLWLQQEIQNINLFFSEDEETRKRMILDLQEDLEYEIETVDDNDNDDHDLEATMMIANSYHEVTRTCLQDAYLVGLSDEEAIKDYVHDDTVPLAS